jgi:uroporphyrinogen-III synthase
LSVLVTRPEPGAAETARRLVAMGRTPLLAPMLRIVPLAVDLPPPGSLQAVLLTSANALPALGGHAGLPLLAVGDATAAMARARGFRVVHSAGGDARALADLAARIGDPRGLALLLAGQQGQGADLVRRLREAGFAVEHRAVYAARPARALPEAARAALCAHAVEAALFFSAATAHAFVSVAVPLPEDAFASVDCLALSPAVAAELAALPWNRIRIATMPNQDELLGLLT